jgi:hypothetical protein
LSWGKAITLPAVPAFVSAAVKAAQLVAASLPFGALPSSSRTAPANTTPAELARYADIIVAIPKDRFQRQLVHRMVCRPLAQQKYNKPT